MTGSTDPYTVAEALVAAERWEGALAQLRTELADRPDDPRLLALLVRTFRGLEQLPDALNASQRLLTVAPNEAYSYRLVTLVMVDAGWIDEAIGLADRAVRLDPANAANHLALARAWASSRRPQAAREQLAAAQQAVRLAPSSADAHVQIGAALAANDDLDGARAAYLEALRLEPNHPAALNNLAVVDLRAGMTTTASKYIAASLAAAPQGKVARRNLDVIVRRMIDRISWWMLLGPIPALMAGLLGWTIAARLLCVLIVLGPVVTVWRWGSQLTAGQRTQVRGFPRRARRRVFAWPILAGLLGLTALVQAWTGSSWLGTSSDWGYLGLVAIIVMVRVTSGIARHGLRAQWANLRLRLASLRRGSSRP